MEQINLNEITDLTKLNDLYVRTNEAIIQYNQSLENENNNLVAIRTRIAQVQEANQEADQAKEAKKEDAKKPETPAK